MILVLLVAATPWSRRSLQPDVTLCETSVLLALIDTAIPPACEPMLRDAVTSGAEVDHAKLCQCYLEVPDSTMSNLTCVARAGDRQTIYEEYQRCHDFAVVPPRAAGCVDEDSFFPDTLGDCIFLLGNGLTPFYAPFFPDVASFCSWEMAQLMNTSLEKNVFAGSDLRVQDYCTRSCAHALGDNCSSESVGIAALPHQGKTDPKQKD